MPASPRTAFCPLCLRPMLHDDSYQRHQPRCRLVPPSSKEDRFWAQVNKTDTCWLWTGRHNNHGYGQFTFENRQETAHRFAYRTTFGPIPDGMHVLHHCDKPLCCRPEHLFLGTNLDNIRDRNAKLRFNAKLTEEQVLLIRERVRAGATFDRLAHEFGVTAPTVARAAKGLSWQAAGGHRG